MMAHINWTIVLIRKMRVIYMLCYVIICEQPEESDVYHANAPYLGAP